MANFIQHWLGIDVILTHLHDMRRLRLDDNRNFENKLDTMHSHLAAANRGMGRLIAKLDPMYGQDEMDHKRKAASDELSDQVIKKLIAEHLASNRTTSTTLEDRKKDVDAISEGITKMGKIIDEGDK